MPTMRLVEQFDIYVLTHWPYEGKPLLFQHYALLLFPCGIGLQPLHGLPSHFFFCHSCLGLKPSKFRNDNQCYFSSTPTWDAIQPLKELTMFIATLHIKQSW